MRVLPHTPYGYLFPSKSLGPIDTPPPSWGKLIYVILGRFPISFPLFDVLFGVQYESNVASPRETPFSAEDGRSVGPTKAIRILALVRSESQI